MKGLQYKFGSNKMTRTQMIEVVCTLNTLGHIHIEPYHEVHKKMIGTSNKYDGTYEVYMQGDIEVFRFLKSLPIDIREQIKAGWITHYNIDTYTYRHMVGGQCD